MLKSKSISFTFALILIVIVLAVIISAPMGVADGGSLYKTLESVGLSYKNEPTAEHFETVFEAAGEAEAADTRALFVMAARHNRNGEFKIKSLAFIYLALFVLGMALLIKSGLRNDNFNLPFALLCVFVFSDIVYTSYFNTLYSEAAVLTTFIPALAFLLLCCKAKEAKVYYVLLASIFALLFAFCGTLQAWIAVMIGVVIMRVSFLRGRRAQRSLGIIMGGIVMLSSAALIVGNKNIDYEKNIYNAVFFGVAKHESVSEIGLDESLDDLGGVFYSEEVVQQHNLKEGLYGKIAYPQIFMFYITHPSAFASEINFAAKNAYNARASYLGNFAKGSSNAGGQTKFFALYSSLKAKFIPNTLSFTAFFWLLYLAVLFYILFSERKYRAITEVALFIALSAMLCLIAPLILTGGFEIGRQLFTYNIMFDGAVIFAVIAGGRYMSRRKRKLQRRYGVDQ